MQDISPERRALISELAEKYEPFHSCALILRDVTEGRSPGGIIIPDVSRNYAKRGVILSIGPGHRLEDGSLVPRQTKVGDLVLFNIYGATAVPGFNELVLVDEWNIEGVLEEVT